MVCLGLQGSFGFCYSDLFRHSPFGFRHFPAFDIRHSSSINSIDMDSRLAVDSTVLLLYFVLIISIGLYMGRKEENLKDFALGGRRIPWWAVLASLVAAETSAGTFFGTPGEGFSHRDYTYLQLSFCTIIGRVLVSYIFIKPYYDYKVFSIYEYLTARFGVASKNAASAVFMITRLLASGARLYVAAIALALAYEMISGTRPNQTQTLWIYLGVTMGTHVTVQDMVQRMLTAPDIRRSRRSLICSALADIPIALTFLSIGLLLWVYYQAHPDPTLSKTPNETFCHFILYQMPVGLRGLLLAGIFATAMGSLSTALNALATSFTRDWYGPYLNPEATDAQSLSAVRWATVWFSVLMIIVASTTAYLVIVHPNVLIIPIVLGIFGYTYGSLLGVFFAGMLTRTRGNDRGNIIAMIVGFSVVAILSGLPNNIAGIFGTTAYRQPNWLPVMAFPWWICFGTMVTFFVAILFHTPAPGETTSRAIEAH